ncbi:ABC transporter ATP-binding protein [Natrialbaceae archaeon A-arb3/5]
MSELDELERRPDGRSDEQAHTTTKDVETAGCEFRGTDLVIGYEEEPIIDGESIEIPPGSITALVGPNGSGKSTLLKGLARQHEPESGTVLLDGRDAYDLETKEFARKLGMLAQESAWPEGVTVEELAYHGRYPHRGFFEPVSDADQAAVDRAIDLAGVDELRDREMGSLSGGQKQLAWIAMALAQETDVLLLDEPTTFLDLRHQLQVMETIERLNVESETTVALVLHDIEQAARYADHMVALRDGTVYETGSPTTVVTEQLLAAVFGVEATINRHGEEPRVEPHRPI